MSLDIMVDKTISVLKFVFFQLFWRRDILSRRAKTRSRQARLKIKKKNKQNAFNTYGDHCCEKIK